ncbi:MAG TPA: ATP-dependent 6-phosphofructokinase [Candidatus Avidesulfovibrio excrementigallinarum]|nr:ATP-dependent 6-phosphofructokinase [Candidatus Avidesulfovibrio excrementigallinarum]
MSRPFTLPESPQRIEVPRLGEPNVESSLACGAFLDETFTNLCLDRHQATDLESPRSLVFEAAGPRRKLYFDPGKTKCAIVTCGGLCPGLNDVIRAIVLEAHYAYGAPSVLGIRYGLEGFIPEYRHNVMELTPQVVEHIHQFGGTVLGSSRGPQDFAAIVDALERMNISILFVIGGDGSMKAAQAIHDEVSRRNIRIAVVGIPKTIDNDINFVPQSFGFDTAVDKATEAISSAHVEATGTFNGIGLVKLMGRESGFIAAQAALALRDVNFVLVPEAPFELEGPRGLLAAIKRRLEERGHAVILTAEGAGQHLLQSSGQHDASGNLVLGDIGEFLCKRITEYLKAEKIRFSLKYIDPSYLIRSVPANPNDRVYCGFLGQYAVHAAMAGRTGMVVSKIMDRYVHVPLDLVTRKRRTMNVHSGLWRSVLESTGQWEIAGMYPSDTPNP